MWSERKSGIGKKPGKEPGEKPGKQSNGRRRTTPVVAPYPHPSGAVPPAIPAEFIPRHVAIVMDGNGRWANQRGLPRIEGHKAGEPALLDVMAGAIELGIEYVSVYAFSTENWRRSPEEVRFLMGFNKDVLRRQRNQLMTGGSGSAGPDDGQAVGLRHPRTRRGRGLHPGQQHLHPEHVRQLRRTGRDRRRRRRDRGGSGPGPAQAGGHHRTDHPEVPRRAGPAGRGPVPAQFRANSGSPTSCSGSRPTPSSCSWTPCGRTWTGGRCGTPSRSMPSGTAGYGGA